MDSNAPPSTPPPADNLNDDGLPFCPHLENITTSPLTFATAPQYSGPGQLESSRTAILRDLGFCIHQLSLEFFMKHILPRIPDSICLLKVLEKLRQRKVIVKGRWKAFPHDPFMHAKKPGSPESEAEKRKENEVFAELATIISAIQACVDSLKRRKVPTTTEYESKPDSAPVCCFDQKEGRPDAYFVYRQRFLSDREDGRRLWRDIATTAEFKLCDTRETLADDVKKLCWSMYQIMLEDPRRRFVYGFTIENTMMRIWMGNRTEVLVSEPFNFITEHKTVTYFFLSMLYGSETDLGLDPTMTIFSANGNEIPRYNITLRVVDKSTRAVQELVYRTTELISDDGAKAFRGSGTRVWEVAPVVNDLEQEQRQVLKDHWVDDDRQNEGEILEEILNEPSLSDTARKELSALFLTQIARGDVYIEDKQDCIEKRDGTRTLATRGAEIPADAQTFPLLVSLNHRSSHGAKGPYLVYGSEEDEAQRKVRIHGDKHHHRSVFAERCKPLSREQSLRCVFTALCDITMGIPFMHRCGPGWVDRDISAGNILLLPSTDMAKLADLEYAKRLDDMSSKGIRTGTSNFMAVEVDVGDYVFGDDTKPLEDIPAQFDEDALSKKRTRFQVERDGRGCAVPSRPLPLPQATERPFFHNPVHDLESIWWIAVYFIVNKETGLATREGSTSSAADSVDYAYLTADQREYARSLFYDFKARREVIGNTPNIAFDKHLRSLPPHLSSIATELIELRKQLCRYYRKIEQPSFVIDKNVCNGLYFHFIDAFERIVAELGKQDVLVAPLKPDPDEALRKGLRAAAAEVTGSSRPTKRRKLNSGAAASTRPRKAAKAAEPKKKAGKTTSVPSSSTRVTRSRTRAADLEEQDDTTGVVSESSPTRAARSSSRAGRSRKRAVDPEGKADVASSPRKATKSRTRTTRGKETEDSTTIVASSSTRVTRSRTRTRAVAEDSGGGTDGTGKAVVGRASSSKRKR